MSKQEFLTQLRKGLSGLPQADIEERLTFYDEMLEDKMEEGLSEDEAVLAAGPINEIIAQIVADTPLTKIAKERIIPKKRLSVGKIVLLVLSSPIWIPLGIAAISVIFSLYIVLLAVIFSLWTIFASFIVSSVASVAICIIFIIRGISLSGVAMLSAGIVCAGLSIFMFYGCMAITKGSFILTKKFAVWIKNLFIKKEEA